VYVLMIIDMHGSWSANGMAVNRRYRHHTKSVYPSISIRQIAEQIDELYWSSGAPVATESQDGAVRKMDDFTNDQTISRLNQDFSSSEEYQEGLVRLQELAERRKQAQQKLQKYKALQDELDFLKGPANSVQPNLVTRDGPLALELTKSRALATKLAGRVSGLKRSNSTDADDGRPSKALLMSERARIQSALIDTND
jgi:hypothetical protein